MNGKAGFMIEAEYIGFFAVISRCSVKEITNLFGYIAIHSSEVKSALNQAYSNESRGTLLCRYRNRFFENLEIRCVKGGPNG